MPNIAVFPLPWLSDRSLFSALTFIQGLMSNFGLFPWLLFGLEEPWVAWAENDYRFRRLPSCSWFSLRVIYDARGVPIFMKVTIFCGSS